MLAPEPQPETGIGTLFTRLIDEGRELVRTEINLYRAITLNRLRGSQSIVALAVVAALLAQASVTALLLGLVLGLARWLGPIGSGIVVAVVGLLVAGLLLRVALKRFARVTGQVDGTGSES